MENHVYMGIVLSAMGFLFWTVAFMEEMSIDLVDMYLHYNIARVSWTTNHKPKNYGSHILDIELKTKVYEIIRFR